MIQIGVVGCGRWGPNHIRVFSGQPQTRVAMACDALEARRLASREMFPDVPVVAEYDELLASPVDAVVVATPVESHYDLVRRALLADKDVLCEKPLCLTTAEARELTALARQRARILMVGHVYLFNTAIQQIRTYLQDGLLGPVRYAYSVRANRGPVRQDVGVVYDLASHDVSIFDYLFNCSPESVGGYAAASLRPNLEDVAFLWLRYPHNVHVHVHVSWLAARKTRQLSIVGDHKAVEWDELAGVGPLKLVDPSPADSVQTKNFGEWQQVTREAGISIPRIAAPEPLDQQARHFVECVRQRQTPLCDGDRATRVVDTLERLQQALRNGRHS